MVNFVFVGCQNGDEGKGKEAHRLGKILEEYISPDELIVFLRYQGGGNAGHTFFDGDKVYKTHQVPSGFPGKKTFNLCGTRMFLNPRKLAKEISDFRERGVLVTPSNLGISSKAHVTLDYHTMEDQADFNLAEHTTTGNGIKQTARDKAFRKGIRFVEFLDKSLMTDIIKKKVFPDGLPSSLSSQFGSIEEFVSSYDSDRDLLRDFVVLESDVINNPKVKHIIQEGAQGFFLSMDDGQYPGVTSSNPEQPSIRPDVIVGVYKAYVSSVGIGDRPFVSEMDRETQELIVRIWKEFGTTTGKQRHLGYFDALAARYAADRIGIDFVNLTCLDRLEVLGQKDIPLRIVTGYEIDGEAYTGWQTFFDRRDVLHRAKPVFEECEVWDRTLESDGKTLTPPAAKYVSRIEELIGKPIATIGVGQRNEDTLVLREYFS